MVYIVVGGLYGAVFGSFAGVCATRIPRLEFLTGRSRCDSCSHPLSWYELIPILSLLVLKGRCRYCHIKIARKHVVLEILFAVFVPFVLRFSDNLWQAVFYICLLFILAVLAFIDWQTQLVPDMSHIVLILLCPLYYQGIWFHIKGGLALFVFLWSLHVFSKEGIGGGDIKLLCSLGFILGVQVTFYILSWATILALPVAVYLKYSKQMDGLPFVPFIALGTCIQICFVLVM